MRISVQEGFVYRVEVWKTFGKKNTALVHDIGCCFQVSFEQAKSHGMYILRNFYNFSAKKKQSVNG